MDMIILNFIFILSVVVLILSTNALSVHQVSMLHSSSVVCELLQSCYTGMLQFSAKEIVNYLTAASYLQMEHVVEKCRGALSQYMQPQSCSPIVNVSTSNKSIQTVKSEDYPSMPVIVSVSTHSLGSLQHPCKSVLDLFQILIMLIKTMF